MRCSQRKLTRFLTGSATPGEVVKMTGHLAACVACRSIQLRTTIIPTVIYRLVLWNGFLYVYEHPVVKVTKKGRYKCGIEVFNGFNPASLYSFRKYAHSQEYYTTQARLDQDTIYLIKKYKPKGVNRVAYRNRP